MKKRTTSDVVEAVVSIARTYVECSREAATPPTGVGRLCCDLFARELEELDRLKEEESREFVGDFGRGNDYR